MKPAADAHQLKHQQLCQLSSAHAALLFLSHNHITCLRLNEYVCLIIVPTPMTTFKQYNQDNFVENVTQDVDS